MTGLYFDRLRRILGPVPENFLEYSIGSPPNLTVLKSQGAVLLLARFCGRDSFLMCDLTFCSSDFFILSLSYRCSFVMSSTSGKEIKGLDLIDSIAIAV